MSIRTRFLAVVVPHAKKRNGDEPVFSSPLTHLTPKLQSLPLLMLLAACGGDAPTALQPPVTTQCNGVSTSVLALQPLEGTTIRAESVGCIALAGYGASYLILPQLTGAALPYGGYGYRVGDPDADPSPALATNRDMVPSGPSAGDDAQIRLDRWLRASEARIPVAPRPHRRADLAAPSASLAVPALGDAREFSVLSSLDTPPTFARVGTRLRFAGAHVLLYIDTLATDAFTPEEIETVGTIYDKTLYLIDQTTFGDASDIDGNGRVIFVLTPTVNALASASQCAISGYIRGFFYGYDLGSTDSTSNRGEMLYGLVPDPAGRWSCAHTKADVMASLPPTFVHELQHLISYGEHVIKRGGSPEEPWLNEGLSHLAEELGAIHYEQQFPAPAGRTTPTQLFPDLAEPYITPDLLYSDQFLFLSQQYSITSCAPGTFCSLPERGAAWLFLRWLGDQKGSDIYRRLVQSPLTGVANLEAVSGEGVGALLGDFVIAVSADSLVGVARDRVVPRYRFVSRNLRQLYRALYDAYGPIRGVARPFPVDPATLTHGASVTGTMRPGTFAPYRLDVPAQASVSLMRFSQVDGTPFAASAGAQLSIFRLSP